jgi:hypothetical protein
LWGFTIFLLQVSKRFVGLPEIRKVHQCRWCQQYKWRHQYCWRKQFLLILHIWGKVSFVNEVFRTETELKIRNEIERKMQDIQFLKSLSFCFNFEFGLWFELFRWKVSLKLAFVQNKLRFLENFDQIGGFFNRSTINLKTIKNEILRMWIQYLRHLVQDDVCAQNLNSIFKLRSYSAGWKKE